MKVVKDTKVPHGPCLADLREAVQAMRARPISNAFWRRHPVRRALREVADLTQAQLADLIGTDPSTVARWEAGTRRGSGGHADHYRRVIESLESAMAARLELLATYGEYLKATSEERRDEARDLLKAFDRVLDTDTEYWPLRLDSPLSGGNIQLSRQAD